MSAPLRVLLVEDSDTDAERVVRELRSAGHQIEAERIDTADAMRGALAAHPFDLVISDWSLEEFTARAALAILDEFGLAIPFIVVSETIGEEKAVEAIRAGASDFVLKPGLARLAPAVARGLLERDVRRGDIEGPGSSREQQLHSQKLEAIGRLAGGVAHDFSNLLSIILSYTDLVIAELDPRDPLRCDLLEVQRAGQQAAWLTGQLLAFGRRQVLLPQVVDLNEVLLGMEQMIRRLIGEDVELTVGAGTDLSTIAVDPGQIEQVLMNLAVNARDAMPRGGRLRIETCNVELDEIAADAIDAVAGPHVLLSVTDSGCGMDPTVQARIFEPFFTTKERGKGTGLGLSTVFGIVQQSGGALSVESEPDCGTTFRIYFVPVDAVVEQIAAPPAESVDLRGCETILLVEDDEPLRVLVRGILHRYGYHVLEAQSAGDALLIGEQHGEAIDLLLTDVVMPRISGRQLADRLRPLRPEMRVLYVSGYTDDEMHRHGILGSGTPLLQKPITPELLGCKIREVLDQGRPACEETEAHEIHPRVSRR